MNSCPDCTVMTPCPWWCDICLLHHPVRDMVRSCRVRAGV